MVRGGVLTVRDVAAALSVSTATVYALVERGELASFRVMNSIRVLREDLDALIAVAQSASPAPSSPRTDNEGSD